ncbi:unnamed protein product, partial [Staurois parvus]
MSVQIHPCLQLLQPPYLRNKLIIGNVLLIMMSQIMEAKPCNKICCKLCNQINPSKSVRHSKGIFNISGSYSCTSSNVVYLIQCRMCNKGSYVWRNRTE